MKTIQTIISKVSLVSFISLVSFVSLVSSCSKSDDFDGGQDLNAVGGVEIGGLSGYSTYFEENMDLQMTRSGDASTRAWAIPSGYVEYEGGVQPIAIAFAETKMDKSKLMGHFYKREDKDLWLTNVEFEASHDYYLYGFIPNLPVIKYDITDRNPGDDGDDDSNPETDSKTDGNFADGAIMTLQDVPTVMPNDLCVVIGAKHGTDKEHDSGLRRGDFSFRTSQGTDGKDYVFLLFDHLYAALSINMKVYADYDAIRTIKLKSLRLSTQVEETVSTDKTNITIKLHSTPDGSESPIDTEDGIVFESAGEPIASDGMEFWSNGDGEQLTTSSKQFIGHFMPNGITKLVLTSVYDVYDKGGNLIRQNFKATNTMVLKDLLTEQFATERGKRYIIDMTIKPTYLYMLSEPDLDNPMVVSE